MKVDAQCDGSAIDARLDFATEEWLAGMLATAIFSDEFNGPAHPFRVRVNSEIVKQLQCGEGRDPRLPGVRVRLVEVSRWEARAAGPLAVFTLQCQQPRAPALDGDARALLRHDLGWCVDEIPKYLPTDGRV